MKRSLRHDIVGSFREIIFGLEDSLVSTLGAVTGIAVGAGSEYVVILSGLVLIAAEGMSMAAGSYLSSKSAVQAQEAFHGKKQAEKEYPVRAAFVMGGFYFVGGAVPLFPYFFLPITQAILVSIPVTVFVLFGVGVWAANFTGRSKLTSGLEMAGISLAAAVVGYVIGRLVALYFGVSV